VLPALPNDPIGYAGGLLAIILLQAAITTAAQAPATSPIASPPEIPASLPSGQYAGRTHRDGKDFDVSLVIDQTKPGGRVTGTVMIHNAPTPCEALFPISGEIVTGGGVRIESKEGVARGCERTFNLKLAGHELTGTLVDSSGAFQINLKKQ
jgi:hypothetical protein